MAIKIYTYANPYEIDRETFWHEIKDCPHFCVSQTMVNGMETTYPELKNRMQLTTVRILLNALYEDWEDLNTRVRQMMEVDAAIRRMAEQEGYEETVQRSLAYNAASIVNCIRMFQELGLQSMPFAVKDLTLDQKYLVKIYQQILHREKTAFAFAHVQSLQEIEAGIETALHKKHPDANMNVLNQDAIVLHGIHQFSPAMLCAIEDISKHKDVILLFNYQEQYKAIYQTWLNIYTLFEQPIYTDAENQFHPMHLMVDSYASNLLADRMGKLANGDYNGTEDQKPLEVIEFANMTEFAGYAARLFEQAQKRQNASGDNAPVLSMMSEQLYSASGRVNDILRAYFPEQFGERHFLDYPLGHFFVSATNMWDPENQCAKVDNLSDIKECLECGIIAEQCQGQHLNSFNQIIPFIEKEVTLTGMIKKLTKLKKYVKRSSEELKRVGYMSISKDDLTDLIRALEELNQIIGYFFTDFENGADNFRRFYQRIQSFIVKRVANLEELDDEMRTVIQKLLARMQKSDLPETGTFICLKQTMSYYLSQDDTLVKGAHWIVRDFEQIDGDILRSSKQKANQTCYHFCCLSDKDICAAKDERLPWPLDIHFFEVACEPLDWKYQIFLKSKVEFRNFKKYALLYGLEFNRIGCKLSYVKSEHDKENDVFHMLTLLGVKIKPYREFRNQVPPVQLAFHPEGKEHIPSIEYSDQIKWMQCPYRFALESLMQERTVYRERFLILNYMKVLLIKRVRTEMQGEKYTASSLQDSLQAAYQQIADKFHILNELEKTQLIHTAYQEIRSVYLKQKSSFPRLSGMDLEKMRLREDFLRISDIDKLKETRDIPDKDTLMKLLEEEQDYHTHTGNYCTMCASKDICLKRAKENM